MVSSVIKKRIKNESGQAMIEFALVLPLLLAILCGIIDFGWLFYNQINVENSARESARAICVYSTETDYDDVLEEATNVAKQNLRDPDTLNDPTTNPGLDPGVEINYLDGSGTELSIDDLSSAKMVRVTVRTQMPIFTFVLQTFSRGDKRQVSSSTTFKVEGLYSTVESTTV